MIYPKYFLSPYIISRTPVGYLHTKHAVLMSYHANQFGLPLLLAGYQWPEYPATFH